jgi:SPP1 family predicted phage head-tail adaptor
MSVFESLLNNEFTVARRRRTSDGQGGWAIDHVPIGTVRGRLRPASSRERTEAQRQDREITHVLYVAAGADIARGDRVTLAPSTGSGQALAVEVEAVREPSQAGEHLEIDCRELQREQAMEEGS